MIRVGTTLCVNTVRTVLYCTVRTVLYLEALAVVFADVLVLLSGLDLVNRLSANVPHSHLAILLGDGAREGIARRRN